MNIKKVKMDFAEEGGEVRGGSALYKVELKLNNNFLQQKYFKVVPFYWARTFF